MQVALAVHRVMAEFQLNIVLTSTVHLVGLILLSSQCIPEQVVAMNIDLQMKFVQSIYSMIAILLHVFPLKEIA
jgi:hypothetical protein